MKLENISALLASTKESRIVMATFAVGGLDETREATHAIQLICDDVRTKPYAVIFTRLT